MATGAVAVFNHMLICRGLLELGEPSVELGEGSYVPQRSRALEGVALVLILEGVVVARFPIAELTPEEVDRFCFDYWPGLFPGAKVTVVRWTPMMGRDKDGFRNLYHPPPL